MRCFVLLRIARVTPAVQVRSRGFFLAPLGSVAGSLLRSGFALGPLHAATRLGVPKRLNRRSGYLALRSGDDTTHRPKSGARIQGQRNPDQYVVHKENFDFSLVSLQLTDRFRHRVRVTVAPSCSNFWVFLKSWRETQRPCFLRRQSSTSRPPHRTRHNELTSLGFRSTAAAPAKDDDGAGYECCICLETVSNLPIRMPCWYAR